VYGRGLISQTPPHGAHTHETRWQTQQSPASRGGVPAEKAPVAVLPPRRTAGARGVMALRAQASAEKSLEVTAKMFGLDAAEAAAGNAEFIAVN
jgi:hypothetical protein